MATPSLITSYSHTSFSSLYDIMNLGILTLWREGLCLKLNPCSYSHECKVLIKAAVSSDIMTSFQVIFASEGMLSIETVKCSVRVHKSSYQSPDAIQIHLRYIYEITMKLGEETKTFSSCLCCVPLNKILKGLLARSVTNKAGFGHKGKGKFSGRWLWLHKLTGQKEWTI